MRRSPLEQCNHEMFRQEGRIICRQSPIFVRPPKSEPPPRRPNDYEDVTDNDLYFKYTLDVPSDREPAYQFFGRKRLLLRTPLDSSHNVPILLPGDTIESTANSSFPKRYLLANYEPVFFANRHDGAIAQFIAYEMDQDVWWIKSSTTRDTATDPVTGLDVQTARGTVHPVVPVTLESLYEERDRSLVTKEDRRRVISGAPFRGNDFIRLHYSSDDGDDLIEMRIIRSEYVAGIFVCEAL